MYGQKPSKSADAARKKEFERVWAMTPMQRALLALRLGVRRKAWVEPRVPDGPTDALSTPG